jgi:hypothetical protein
LRKEVKEMNDVETKYGVNEQGMIVEEINASDINESKKKINLQDSDENVISENTAKA